MSAEDMRSNISSSTSPIISSALSSSSLSSSSSPLEDEDEYEEIIISILSCIIFLLLLGGLAIWIAMKRKLRRSGSTAAKVALSVFDAAESAMGIDIGDDEEEEQERDDNADGASKSSALLFCDSCGSRLDYTNQKFCTNCGKPTGPRRACAKCNTTLKLKDKFCPECGTRCIIEGSAPTKQTKKPNEKDDEHESFLSIPTKEDGDFEDKSLEQV